MEQIRKWNWYTVLSDSGDISYDKLNMYMTKHLNM